MMKFFLACCIFYMTTLSQQKLILSNTFQVVSQLEIGENQTNLTIWMQIRYSIIKYKNRVNLYQLFRIADQNDQEYLIITLVSLDEQTATLYCDLQNQIRDQQQLDITKKQFEWIYISVQINTFYIKVFNDQINITYRYNQKFNATLYAFGQDVVQILVYDQKEFSNQVIFITNIALKSNTYPLNININYLKIFLFAKIYFNFEQNGVIYSQFINKNTSINLHYNQGIMYIKLLHAQGQYDIFQKKSNLISGSNIQLYLNNEKFELTIQLDQYVNFNGEIEYLFRTEIVLYNSYSLKWDTLMIINNIEEKDEQDFRYLKDCLNCQGSKFQNYFNRQEFLYNISEDIKLSNYFLNIFPNYYEYVCTDKKLELKDQSCVEWPKYYGEYCYSCQYYQYRKPKLLGVIELNYQYYFDTLEDMPYKFLRIPIGMVYEQDLNIFIFKIKDIYLIYLTAEKQFYCENGYIYKSSRCVKQSKQCQIFEKVCALCSQNYSLSNSKCIRCQRNCLNCRIMNKKLYCLLFIDNYYQDEYGLLKKCKLNQKDLLCQEREDIIKNLTLLGHNICQLSYQHVYDPQRNQEKCYQIDLKQNYKYFITYQNQIKIYEQKLEIQDMLLLQSNIMLERDQQINLLIYHQQVNRLSILSKQFEKNFIKIQRQLNFETFSQTNQTTDNINSQKFIFYDVYYFQGNSPILIYLNQQFSSINDLYKQIPFDFKIVQFDIVFLNYYLLKRGIEQYQVNLDFKGIENVFIIFNITFKISSGISGKCIQFKFQADQIILNNLNLSNIDSKCQQQFIISADGIFIKNLLLENSKFQKIFVLQNFVILICNNFLILNSKFSKLIIAGIEQNYRLDLSVDISYVYFFGSDFDQFIQISNVDFIYIYQISFIDTILNHDIISIIDHSQEVYICNIIHDNTTSQLSSFISIIGEDSSSFINITKITFYKALSILSRIIRIKNINQIFIQSIYLVNVTLNDTRLIYIEQFEKCYIGQIFSKQASFNESEIVMALSGQALKLSDIYLIRIDCFFTGIFQIQNFQDLYIKKINIQSIISYESFFLSYSGFFIHLQQLIIINYENQKSHLINIMSDYNFIERVLFKNFYLKESSLIKIETKISYSQIKKILVLNMQVKHRLLDQLIFIENSSLTQLYQIAFKELYVQSPEEYFCIIKLNEIIMMEIKQLFLNNIKANFPAGQMTFIDSKIQDLKILDSNFYNIQQVNLIKSITKILRLDNLQIKKVASRQAFIFHESYSWFQQDQLFLINLNVNDINGSLLELIGQKIMITECRNITIFNYLNSGSMFIFIYYGIQAYKFTFTLRLLNIMIQNEKTVMNQPNNGIIFFIKYPNITFIQQLYINNSNSQLLFIDQSFFLYITGLYIYNTHSQNQVIQVISEKTSLQSVKLNNFQMVNFTFQRSVFLFNNFSFESQISLNQILINNFKSDTIFKSDISINLNRIFIYSGSSQYLFHAYKQKIELNQSLITNIKQQTILSESRVIIIKHSEIADSKIIYNDSTLTLEQSSILGNTESQNNLIKILLSLNNGLSVINYQQIENNLYLSEFSNNNNYLYLPSGQDIQQYQYFDYKTSQYQKIYDSISFINKYYQQIECQLSQKYENKLISTIPLQMVPGLNIINNLVVTLNPFHKEKFIKLDLTCDQNDQFLTYRTLIKTFNCQLGEYLNKDQCKLCEIDLKLYSVGYNQPICQYMDMDKIKELKIGQIKLYQFYWRFSLSNKYIEVCQTDSCLGGWKTGDQSCKIGYIGAICSECDINNLRGDGNYGKIDDECKLCYFDYSIYLKLLCLIIYQLAIIYINYYTNKQQSEQYLFIRIAQRKFTEILLKQNVNQATIILKLYYNYLLTLFLLKESIQFGYYIRVSLNLIYNPNYIAIPQFDCLIHSQVSLPVQYAQLLYKIFMPLLIFNIFLTIYVITIKLRLSKHSIYTIIISLITIFQQNQYIIIQSLIRLSEKVQYSKIYWILEYKASQFYSNIHQRYLFLLIIHLIILFILTNIIIFYWTKIINRRIFNNLKISLFINKQYKNSFYYWEYVRMLYIYLFMVAIYSQDYDPYVIILTLLYCTINHPYKPFVLKNLNKIDSFIFDLSTFSYFAILIGKYFNSFNTFTILIVSNTILFKIFTNYFIHSFNHQYRKTKIQFQFYLIKLVPQLSNFINLQNAHKIKYYYSVLKFASKKQTNSISGMFPNLLSKSTPYTPIEIELSNLNIR